MIQERKNIFETNSSSTHSVCLTNATNKYNWNELDEYVSSEDRRLHIKFGEFGWGDDEYEDAYNKLSYLLTMILELRKASFGKEGIKTLEEFYSLDEFILVESIVLEHTSDCLGIVIDDSEIKFIPYDEENIDQSIEIKGYVSHNGYIDHQSYENYKCLYDFLEEWETNIEDFIFNESLQLIIDSDNS